MAVSGMFSACTAALMFCLRPTFKSRPETTFLAGLLGAVVFFFLLVFVGNLVGQFGTPRLGWFSIALCELVALTASVVIHPVCATTCLLFSVPVVIYIKWAATKVVKMAQEIGASKKTD
jgi:uncharacterized membrane protein